MYWHIGGTAIRLRRVTPLSVKGSNNADIGRLRCKGRCAGFYTIGSAIRRAPWSCFRPRGSVGWTSAAQPTSGSACCGGLRRSPPALRCPPPPGSLARATSVSEQRRRIISMCEPVRLLHLSDLHFRGRTHWDSDPVLRALTGYIAAEVRGGLAPDLVVITGDLAFAGGKDEYAAARIWLERELWPALTRDPAAPLDRDRLLLVPGNHDADRGLVGKGVRFMQDGLLEERSQEAVADLLRDDHGRAGLLRRHDAYLVFYSEWLGADQPLPWWQSTFQIRGQRLHAAGLGSAWMACGDTDRGRLLLGRYQINQTVLHPDGEGAHWRLALLHHPWDYLAEFDTHEARQLIHLHRDLVLRGHLHEGEAALVRPADPARAYLELAAGCVYDGSRYPNAFQWIELSPQPRRVRVKFRTWNKGAWQVDRNQPGCPDGQADFPPDPTPPPSLATPADALILHPSSLIPHPSPFTPRRLSPLVAPPVRSSRTPGSGGPDATPHPAQPGLCPRHHARPARRGGAEPERAGRAAG
ncbi:hypothetical protein THSYN_05065 [Candidatus Thiodictyon syntrophicum]|uniref:Calcineurin-like phosphoesterase domain-containing protein n=2 Tax=Candidatus Thiodictyon syntrophicum TaxID=1166950 RepID=A0A2K8UGD2_9GAMM|nr:hypothetical protein THSYN_05065 [Candidatus Thiodictyon syntrophicum]